MIEETALASQVVALLEKHQLTISTAESCTGGLIAATLVNIPGVSAVFHEGYITYSDESKHRLVGVSEHTLATYGAVSKQTALELAKGAALFSGADMGVSSTGIAGPDGGTAQTPVGLIYIACYYRDKTKVKQLRLTHDRTNNRKQTVLEALKLVIQVLEEEHHL